MSVKVLVNSTPKSRVSISSSQRSGVRTISNGAKKLSDLLDVDATDLDDNETLVYDEANQKFIIKTLPVVDGGTF